MRGKIKRKYEDKWHYELTFEISFQKKNGLIAFEISKGILMPTDI